jgi:hypothetical protein
VTLDVGPPHQQNETMQSDHTKTNNQVPVKASSTKAPRIQRSNKAWVRDHQSVPATLHHCLMCSTSCDGSEGAGRVTQKSQGSDCQPSSHVPCPQVGSCEPPPPSMLMVPQRQACVKTACNACVALHCPRVPPAVGNRQQGKKRAS